MINIFKNKKKSKYNLSDFSFSFLQEENDGLNGYKEDNKKSKKVKEGGYKKSIYLIYFIVLFIFIYILFSMSKTLFTKNKVDVYEVKKGQITKHNAERGFIFREETVYKAEASGYINFLSLSNTRVNKGNLIYIVNSDSKINIEDKSLKAEDYVDISNLIRNYSDEDLSKFYEVYNYSERIKAYINELSLISNLSNVVSKGNLKVDFAGFSKKAGIISYVVDGYENDNIYSFNEKKIAKSYEVKVSKQNNTVREGEDIYKIISNPTYDIVFSSKNKYDDLIGKNVEVFFQYDNIRADGKLTDFVADDGRKYYRLSINKYLERFLDRRVVNFEIVSNDKMGLKIPVSAIVEKNCYKIPRRFLKRNDMDDEYILKRLDGDDKTTSISLDIASYDNEYYYLSTGVNIKDIKYGMVIVDDNNDYFTLDEVVKLKCAYNVNKGYAVLKNVEILEMTNEYAIIDKNTSRGLVVYDRIAINANRINDGDLIS